MSDSSHTERTRASQRSGLADRLASSGCLKAVCGVWLAILVAGLLTGHDKLVVIAVVAFVSMAVGWWFAIRVGAGPRLPAIADGLAGGAMLTSAALFLLPMAVGSNTLQGCIGVAAGFVLGIALDRLMDIDHGAGPIGDASVVAISIHAAAAGFVMGLIYARMPSLGVLLGVAIISHKLPAGYALARNRAHRGLAGGPIIWPATLVGLAAIPVALVVPPGTPADNAGLFGLATGVFMHVGQHFSRQHVGTQSDVVANRGFVIALVVGALAVILMRTVIAG